MSMCASTIRIQGKVDALKWVSWSLSLKIIVIIIISHGNVGILWVKFWNSVLNFKSHWRPGQCNLRLCILVHALYNAMLNKNTCILCHLAQQRPSPSSSSMYQNFCPSRHATSCVLKVMSSHSLDHGCGCLFKANLFWNFHQSWSCQNGEVSVCFW